MIKVEGLSKIYGKGETKVEALKNINLEIKKVKLLQLLESQVQENQLFFI